MSTIRLVPNSTFVLIAAATSLAAQVPTHTVLGQAGSRTGWSVAGAGDVNGDNFDDFIVGSPFDGTAATDAGKAEVFSGANGALLWTFFGANGGAQFGRAVGGAGDVNGDGFDDLIVGSPGDTAAGLQAGAAYVYSGRDGTLLFVRRGQVNDSLGWSVSGAGDIDRDGNDDVIIGGPEAPSPIAGPGYAVLVSGRTGAVIRFLLGTAFGDNFGWSVSGAGDLNGDGVPEVIVGAPQEVNGLGQRAGTARVYSGANGSVLRKFDGVINQDRLGWAVRGGGDIDNDGTRDIVIGAPGVDIPVVDAGSVYAISGADWSTIWVFRAGPLIGAQLGYSVGIGDFDADDHTDVIAGAPFANKSAEDSGAARSFSGRTGLELHTYAGDSAGDLAGWSVAGAGDIDRDGFADLIVGAVLDNAGGAFAGSAKVYRGTAYQRHDAISDLTRGAGAQLGHDVRNAGDIDGDGTDDIIVGAVADSTLGRTGNGTATVYAGDTRAVLYTFDGDASGDALGTAVAGAGDVNNDGRDDVIAGAPGDDTTGQNAGMVRVWSGVDGSVLRTIRGASAGDQMGSGVAGIGDVNGDDFDDFAVASTGANGQAGFVQVFSGATGSQLYIVMGANVNDLFGRSIAPVGDLNGDTIGDFIVGAPQLQMAGPGYARVISGADGSPLHTVNGDVVQDLFGWSVSGAGDFNDDGTLDFAVGAPLGDENGNASGYARIYSGQDGSLIRGYAGFAAGDELGRSVAAAGDANGDGVDDLLVGASKVATVAAQAGAAYVFSNPFIGPVQTFLGDAVGDQFGWAAAGIGDVNGDGFADLVVGARFADTAGVDSGLARVLTSVERAFPGVAWDYGAGCRTSGNTLPRVGIDGRPAIGSAVQQRLATALPGTAAFMILDVFPQSIDLTPNGMPGCRLLTLPTLALATATNAAGAASFNVPVPNATSIVGIPVFFQWIVFDPAANPGMLVFSDGQAIQVGNP